MWPFTRPKTCQSCGAPNPPGPTCDACLRHNTTNRAQQQLLSLLSTALHEWHTSHEYRTTPAELRSKLQAQAIEEFTVLASGKLPTPTSVMEHDLRAALKDLGFNQTEIRTRLARLDLNSGHTIQHYLTEALK